MWSPVTFEAVPWERPESPYASRRQARLASGPYQAAVPPLIAAATVDLPSDVSALAEDASAAIARFDATVGAIAAPFASILLRTESASSSEIEDLTSGAKQIALAEIGQSTSGNARLVVRNVSAMNAALELADALDGEAIVAMHRALLEESAPHFVGAFRDQPVWIGGGSLSPHAAAFVPPRHERVPELIEDLVVFSRRDDVPLLAQTAIAHAQFETIHPFPDGNGRTGRALMHAMLRRGDLTRSVTIPVSAGLLHEPKRYFAALTAYRAGDISPIVRLVAESSFAALANGGALVAELQRLEESWRATTSGRGGSAAARLLPLLLAHPVVNTRTVVELLDVTTANAQLGIDRLVGDGVLTRANSGQRNRAWQAAEVLAALDAFADRARRGRWGGSGGALRSTLRQPRRRYPQQALWRAS